MKYFCLYLGLIALIFSTLAISQAQPGYAHQNRFNSKTITFSVELTNNYVNNTNASARVNLVSGSPFYIAVVKDDTNYINDANWQAYAGTNINIDLGSTEGWHEIWIGLRGAADAVNAAAWERKRLKLDLTPPQIVITNPTSGLVTQPMIELQGYSPESLSHISYDITNAAGFLANQQILVLNEAYDTKTYDFTSPTFQGFDISLTKGLNVITIHATDRAGNTTATNFSFTLDYASKTNPPEVQIIWPQDKTSISGTNFTLRGMLSDFTATVSVTITDPHDNSNIINGTVERDGKFWVEDLPLSSGTNQMTLTVTDVVGNTVITNLSVSQSALVFTINDVADPNQLWQHTVSLTGTISDHTYAVWVNGVKGINNGDGTWSAVHVPVTQGGTASFDGHAYAPNERQPDGSYGN
ncbi:MAG TPA: hypothetical protein VGO57_11855 [Verrucomicrobiae bacterium]|jgi:hypothetical protein